VAGARLGVARPGPARARTAGVAAPVAAEPPAPAAPSAEPPLDAHALRPTEVAARLATDLSRGLEQADAAARLGRWGANEVDPPEPVSLTKSITRAATEPFVVLLAIAGALAIALGEVRDGLLVLVGLVPIVGADVVTEYRSERALAELRAVAAPRAQVRRSGTIREIPARDVVPGDVVRLDVGDVVPADLRIVRSHALTLDRSILTGESLADEASVEADPPDAELADRRSMAYAGTSVVLGRGEGVVVATGRTTEVGRIAAELRPVDRGRSPLQRELDRLVRILLAVAIGLIVVTVGLSLIRGATLGEALLAGIASAIAAIPEEPPILLAVILGLGAYRLLRRDVLVRRLNAQETLGAVDLIITDKTGTLTENRLALEAIVAPDGPLEGSDREAVLVDAVRAEHDAWGADDGRRRGSFTTALMAAGPTAPPPPEELLEAVGPRDGQPWSWTRARRDGEVETLAVGAPEAVVGLAAGDAGDDPGLRSWHDLIEGWARSGRRLLLLAGGRDDEPLRPRAMLVFADPLRASVPEALRIASEAGIQTTVVTGDHPATAEAIARAAGLIGGRTLAGAEVDRLDDVELAALLPELAVVARATPAQKLRLVQAARAAGRTVATTGDGVNDAPALQRADVAVAMGSGTAIAREAADLVLGDDSFATLVRGLAEGRRIVANVQKGLVFLASTHVALLGFILVASIAGFDQPLLPIQILWLELFIDVTTSVAFEREPAEPDAMRRPPRPRGLPLLTEGLLLRIALAGGVTAMAALAVMANDDGALEHARWLAVNVLVFGQLVRAYMNRRLDRPVYGLPPNWFLAAACLGAAAVQLAIPYVPPLADAFRATPLDAADVAIIALIALAPAVLAEVIRATRRTVWVA
jgi:Ca2+-transporting ATPase